jgi:hypothetical protein
MQSFVDASTPLWQKDAVNNPVFNPVPLGKIRGQSVIFTVGACDTAFFIGISAGLRMQQRDASILFMIAAAAFAALGVLSLVLIYGPH